MLHTSAIAALIDVITSHCVTHHSGMETNHVSVSLDVNFHKTIKCDQNLYALIKLKSREDQLWYLGCDVFNQSGELCYDARHIKSMGPLTTSRTSDIKMQPKL